MNGLELGLICCDLCASITIFCSEDTVEKTLGLIRMNTARAVARSPTFTHKLVLGMRVVRLSVILHQQSRLSSGTQQCRLSSQSRLGCIQAQSVAAETVVQGGKVDTALGPSPADDS